jgi:hypothetical protein
LSIPHQEILNTDSQDLDTILRAIIACPETERDVHYAPYAQIVAEATVRTYVPLEKLSERWPAWAPELILPEKVYNSTKHAEWPSPEVEEALEDAYMADFLLWEESIAEKEDE